MVRRVGVDRIMLTAMGLLLLLGLIMAYSSTWLMAKEKYHDSFHFFKSHLIFVLAGMVIFVAIAAQRRAFYLNPALVYSIVILVLGALVLAFFSGKVNGTYRWIRWMGLSIQPSEFAKIAVVAYLALILGRKGADVNQIYRMLLLFLPFVVIEILILKSPDYGTFSLILMVALVMLFVAGLKFRYFAVLGLVLLPFVALLIKINPMRMNRVLAFLNPEKYIATYGFQGVQSIYAVGSGGIFGQGLGNSTQKLYFLPYAYADFIFSIIGEEIGLIGCLLTLTLFYIFLIRGLNIAKNSGHKQAYLLVVGLTFMIFIQAMLNISVAIGILPTKGIPLPFISIGGSAMVSALISAAIIINVSRHGKTVFLND